MLENYSLNVYSLTCGLRGTFQYLNRPGEQLQGPVATSSVMPVNPVYWACYLKWLCITWTFCWPFTAHLVIWGSQSSANPTPPQSSWTFHTLSNILHSPNIHCSIKTCSCSELVCEYASYHAAWYGRFCWGLSPPWWEQYTLCCIQSLCCSPSWKLAPLQAGTAMTLLFLPGSLGLSRCSAGCLLSIRAALGPQQNRE